MTISHMKDDSGEYVLGDMESNASCVCEIKDGSQKDKGETLDKASS